MSKKINKIEAALAQIKAKSFDTATELFEILETLLNIKCRFLIDDDVDIGS